MRVNNAIVVTAMSLSLAGLVAGCGGGGAAASAPAKPVAESAYTAGSAAAGKDLFTKSCVTCHGPDARGVKGQGNDLVKQSDWLSKQTEYGVYASFFNRHNPSVAKLPGMTDQKLHDAAAYVLSLREK